MTLAVAAEDNLINVDYTTIPGNQPYRYYNWIGIWEGTQVLWDACPQNYIFVENNNPSDALPVYESRAPNMNYIVGYGTGIIGDHHCNEPDDSKPKSKTTVKKNSDKSRDEPVINRGSVCATMQIDAKGKSSNLLATSVRVLSTSNSVLILQYQTPAGNVPKSNGNWVGIWPGSTVSYDGKNNLYKEDVRSDFSEGQLSIENFPITVSTTYTVAYATGPKWSDIASTFTFTSAAY